jgi:hypothetical protein
MDIIIFLERNISYQKSNNIKNIIQDNNKKLYFLCKKDDFNFFNTKIKNNLYLYNEINLGTQIVKILEDSNSSYFFLSHIKNLIFNDLLVPNSINKSIILNNFLYSVKCWYPQKSLLSYNHSQIDNNKFFYSSVFNKNNFLNFYNFNNLNIKNSEDFFFSLFCFFFINVQESNFYLNKSTNLIINEIFCNENYSKCDFFEKKLIIRKKDILENVIHKRLNQDNIKEIILNFYELNSDQKVNNKIYLFLKNKSKKYNYIFILRCIFEVCNFFNKIIFTICIKLMKMRRK